MKLETCETKAIDPLKVDFIDNSFWNLTKKDPEEDDIDYDSLYAELDS
tara:strand:- start:310 stop:453 length:144 start_codon:yes stop_codon:yes gene_type:complete